MPQAAMLPALWCGGVDPSQAACRCLPARQPGLRMQQTRAAARGRRELHCRQAAWGANPCGCQRCPPGGTLHARLHPPPTHPTPAHRQCPAPRVPCACPYLPLAPEGFEHRLELGSAAVQLLDDQLLDLVVCSGETAREATSAASDQRLSAARGIVHPFSSPLHPLRSPFP